MGTRWPLVGRRDELALVNKALSTPEVSGVVLAGAAGVGKTRLAREALTAAEAQGWVTRWAVATEAAASIPFGALAPLLSAVDPTSEDRLELYRRACTDLVQGAGGPPLVLGVDDAHLLDAMSATLVHELALRAKGFVVVTIRAGSPAPPDPVVALWKDGLAERLEVAPLGRKEADELVTCGLNGQVDGTTLDWLWRLTRGNPLFLRELILGGLASGALSVAAGVWRWDGPMIAPPRLVELVQACLCGFDSAERDLLELVAFGEPLDIGLLERMVAAPVLAAVERKGLLSVKRARRRVEVRTVNPLYGQLVRVQTSALGARVAHRRLADALEANGARQDGDLLRIVVWRLEAGGSPTPEQLMGATREAMALFDYQLAERLARAAVDAGAGTAAEYLVGQALLGAGHAEEAELVWAGLTPGGPTDQQQAQLAIARAINLYWVLNLPAKATMVLRQAQATITDPDSREEMDCVRAEFQLAEGSCTKALEAVTGTLDRVGAQDRTVLQALLVATPALFMVGRSDDAIAAAHRGLDLVRLREAQLESPWAPLLLSAHLGHAYLTAGRLDEAEALAQERYQRALGQPWLVKKVLWAGWRGQVARARGQVRTALYWLRESAATVERCPGPRLPFMLVVLGELAHAAALAGELPVADAALAQAEGFSAGGARIHHPLWVAPARAWVAAARGEVSTAIALLLELAEQSLDRGQLTAHVNALHDVARLGQPAQVADTLQRIVIDMRGRLAPIYAAHASALAAQDGAALDYVARAFASIGVNLLAAEAAAEAAHAHRAGGRRLNALTSTRMATALAATCQGAHTPALALLTRPAPDLARLTRREYEIAGLAARGLPSKTIAARLVISVRTVDNTLRQVYAKLGLAGRNELRHVVNLPDPTDQPSE